MTETAHSVEKDVDARTNLLTFGRWIRVLRTARGMSQEDLGQRARINKNTVGAIERGEKNVGIVYVWQLARALDVRPMDLFPEDEPGHPLQARRMPARGIDS